MFKRYYGGIWLFMPIFVGVLALIGLLLGSFFDLQITNLLYVGKNFWSEFVEYGGTLPTAMVIGSAGTLLAVFFKNRNKENDKIWMWLSFVLGILLAGGYWGFDTFSRHTELGLLSKFYIYVPLGSIIMVGLQILVYLFVKDGDSKTYVKKALVIIIATLLVMLLTFGVKLINARPRYMWMVDINRTDLFKQWYQFSTDKTLYKEIMGDNYNSYWIQSWPSGHSSFAALTALAMLLVSCNKKTQDQEIFVYGVTAIWTIAIMIGRILDGHHFLSDVCTGALITIVSVYIPAILMYRKEVQIRELPAEYRD